MPTKQKAGKSDVQQLVGILDEFGEDDIRRAVAEIGLVVNGAPAEALAFAPLPFLLLAQELVTWSITADLGKDWEVEVKGTSSARAGQTFTVREDGRNTVLGSGTLDSKTGAFSARVRVPKGRALKLAIGTEEVSTFKTP